MVCMRYADSPKKDDLMSLKCKIPLVELAEAFGYGHEATLDEVAESIFYLIEESIEFARFMATLQKNNVRLIGIDFFSFPFEESCEFRTEVSNLEVAETNDKCEEWSLPLQQVTIDELRSMRHVWGVDEDRPDLVVLAVLRANRLFKTFLYNLEQRKQVLGIRGLIGNVYRCLTAPPLNYNQALRRRLRAPIETFAAKVYDDSDSARIMRFEVRYDDLPVINVADRNSDYTVSFGWDSLLMPPYSKIRGVSWKSADGAKSQLRKLTCLIPRRVDPMGLSEKHQAQGSFANTAAEIIDDTLCFMRKFDQLKKYNLKLALVNTYRTPHEIYEEDFSESINRSLAILVSFDQYLEKFTEDQKKSPSPYDADGCRYICESNLENARYEQVEVKVDLPNHIVDELESYAHYVPVPRERIDLVIAALILLFDSVRSTLHKQRINALTKMESGYRIAIRGLQHDMEMFESACATVVHSFGNVRVVDNGNSSEVMKAWPANAPHPIDVPVYIEVE